MTINETSNGMTPAERLVMAIEGGRVEEAKSRLEDILKAKIARRVKETLAS